MDTQDKCCCFTGHRIIPAKHLPIIQKNLKNIITDLYNSGTRDFITGGALGFDTIAALTIISLKESLPHIRLVLALPCREQTRNWRKSDIARYNSVLKAADEVVYVSEEYYNGCLLKRNRFMVDNSSQCVFYLTRARGGTAYTIKYAMENNIEIHNIMTND